LKDSFTAWRVGAPYYLTLLLLGLGIGAWATSIGHPWGTAPALIPGLFTLYFFRDPTRNVPQARDAIVSPADGTVVGVARLEETEWYDGPCVQIAVFLSIFNVHVNRWPYAGRVLAKAYKPGEFLDARSSDAGERNEAQTVWIDTPAGPMTVRQISGLVARRIVCLVEEGDSLVKGEKFGMIKFGSRTELYLPPDTEIAVREGDKVKGGATVVARVHERNET